MSAGPLRGYTGFQSRSAEFYELQPGVPEVSRDRKFGTLRQEACETDRITMGPQAGSFVCPKAEQASETMRQTMSVSANDYHPPKKSESKKRLPMDKPFLHDTTQRSFMIDAKKEQKELSQVTDSRMQQAFEIIDEDNTGTIDPIELRPVLFELFGHEPTEHEYRTFDAHCERNDLGVIDFDTWMKGAREALSMYYNRLTQLDGKLATMLVATQAIFTLKPNWRRQSPNSRGRKLKDGNVKSLVIQEEFQRLVQISDYTVKILDSVR
eukprot:gb/GECG01014270.1/.p1 GENE.gb/GECG01014270.1/~~gb/GECG01014270.1/.p1  ORF type:complete len:267 (+),score=26.79 gb/GECG01014270.1/:1-801(+)